MRAVRSGALVAVLLVVTTMQAFALTAPRDILSPPPSSIAGTLRGVVVDSSGAPVAEAQVIVAGLNRVAVTNDSGRFVFSGLPTGRYHLATLILGYRPNHADIVIPVDGSDVTVRIVLARATTVTELSTVQVTATPIGTDPRDVAQSTTEVNAKQLSRTLSTTVAQTLSSEPGIAVRYNGPAASSPVIRGLTGERILVLQDGERAGDLSATSPDHAVSIDPLTAQRIEVVRGPASLLYGNNALGGVVNVISNDLPTSIPEHVDGYINSSAESATPGAAIAGGAAVPLNEHAVVVVRGGARRSTDLRMGGGEELRNSFTRSYTGAAGVGFAGSGGNGGILYRGYKFNYGLPSATNDDAHIEGLRNEWTGRGEWSNPPGSFTSLRLNGTAQWYGHDEIESTGEIGTRFKLRSQSLDALGRTQFGRTTGAIGASGTFRQYQATGEEALTPGATVNAGGIFVYEEIPFRRRADADDRAPSLQLGGRYDMYSIRTKTGDSKFGAGRSLRFDNVSGSIGVSVPLSGAVTFGASAARAFRAPTVEELFSNAFHAAVGTYDIGNPLLRLETNSGLDAIVRVQGTRVSGQLSGYYSRINDYIAPTIVGDTTIDSDGESTTVPLNRFSQADATIRGIEGRIEAEVRPRVVLGLMGDALRGSFLSGDPLPYMPPGRLGVFGRLERGAFTFDSEYRHAFAQTRVPRATASDDPASIATSAYELVSLSAGFTFPSAGRLNSLTLRVDNLLDEQYREATSRIKNFASNPGRNVALVYRMLF